MVTSAPTSHTHHQPATSQLTCSPGLSARWPVSGAERCLGPRTPRIEGVHGVSPCLGTAQCGDMASESQKLWGLEMGFQIRGQ